MREKKTCCLTYGVDEMVIMAGVGRSGMDREASRKWWSWRVRETYQKWFLDFWTVKDQGLPAKISKQQIQPIFKKFIYFC